MHPFHVKQPHFHHTFTTLSRWRNGDSYSYMKSDRACACRIPIPSERIGTEWICMDTVFDRPVPHTRDTHTPLHVSGSAPHSRAEPRAEPNPMAEVEG